MNSHQVEDNLENVKFKISCTTSLNVHLGKSVLGK